MRASTVRQILYVANALCLFGLILALLAAAAYFIEPLKPYYAFPLIAGFSLILLWATLLSTSLRGDLDDPYLIECNQRSGPIHFPTLRLLISDQWDLANAVEIELEEGKYAVSATVNNGIVTRVKIYKAGDTSQARTKFAVVNVDSGHLTFADSTILEHITPKEIEKRILTVLSSREPMTLFLKDQTGTPLGFVVSTGRGDGQYRLRTNADSPTTYVACTFT